MLQIGLDVGGEPSCGGAIVSPWFILTAAHCIWEENSNRVPVKDVTIHVGTIKDSGGKVYSLKSYSIHPKFDHASNS